MGDSEDGLEALEAKFCPPLDPALLQAIVLDYDLTKEDDARQARTILEELRKSAQATETAGFDPSGTGGQDRALDEERGTSCPETGESGSRETDVTSLSNGLSSLDLENEHWMKRDTLNGSEKAEDFEKLDEETKIILLQEVFGQHASRYSIEHTLKKCNGRWNAALDELMNHVYFAEAENSEDGSKTPSKGIDAFSEDQVVRRGRKGKKGKTNRKNLLNDTRSSSHPPSPAEGPNSTANKWQTAGEDIDFISTRIGISAKTVSSTYYEKGASVPQTIGALLKASIDESKHVVTDSEMVAAHAQELGRDFPNIAPEYLAVLIRLTYPSTVAAHELAKALTARPRNAALGGLQVIPQYAPINGDSSILSGHGSKKTSSAGPSKLSRSELDDSSSDLTMSYATARAQAFTQARAAHRKAKSDRLMGGAAAYYGQVGRDYAALSHSASAAAADELANAQSTSTDLDLHGVDVLNAVRIAQEKVERWWAGLGESRVNGRLGASDRQAGYRIVVGAGRHSEGGKGKLGPAISKMLKSQGWRFDSAGAVIVVTGKAKT